MRLVVVASLTALIACGGAGERAQSPSLPSERSPSPTIIPSQSITASPTITASPSPPPDAEVVATSFGNDVQTSVRDHGFTGLTVTSKRVDSVPGYGRTLLLGLTAQDEADALQAVVFAMLGVGEVIPSYESDLALLEIEYVALEDETGGRAFGLVDDYFAYANGDINASKLRSRLFFET